MAKSRRFSKSKSVCAGWSGKSTSTLRYIDAAVRRNEGKLCFIKRKSKDLVSNDRRFGEKNVSIFVSRERSNKNLWTFLRNSSSFLCFLPAFLEKTPVPSPTMSPPVFFSAPPYARTDTPLRIAHSASSQFLPSPFTFTRKSLIQCVLRVKKRAFFRLHPVKETGVKSSPASRCSIDSYSRKVKRRRQKTKNSGRARYACAR